jgi:hypothetical protein
VLLITQQDVDPSRVEGVRRALETGGATVVAELVANSRMALGDDASRAAMATLLGVSDDAEHPETLTAVAARELGNRLVSGPITTSPEGDMLDQLSAGGYLTVRGGALTQIGGSTQSVVLVAGGSRPPAVEPGWFLEPLAGALVDSLRPVVAAQPSDTTYPFVAALRENGDLEGHMVTVDNVDQTPGRVAVVLGLRNLLVTPGDGGDYGSGDGASALIPRP